MALPPRWGVPTIATLYPRNRRDRSIQRPDQQQYSNRHPPCLTSGPVFVLMAIYRRPPGSRWSQPDSAAQPTCRRIQRIEENARKCTWHSLCDQAKERTCGLCLKVAGFVKGCKSINTTLNKTDASILLSDYNHYIHSSITKLWPFPVTLAPFHHPCRNMREDGKK